MVAIADVEVGRWRMLPITICMFFVALNVIPVLGQGIGSQNGPVSFTDNYESQSDAQHFRLLNNGQQAQLVLDEYSGTS